MRKAICNTSNVRTCLDEKIEWWMFFISNCHVSNEKALLVKT